MLNTKSSLKMEKFSKNEEQLKKIREKKKLKKEQKKLKLKERKFQEIKERQPKKAINNHFMGKKEKKKLKKKILKKLIKCEDGNLGKIELISKLDSIEGTILGCVKEILDWGLILELPDFLSAAVHITEISDVYSALMEKFSSGELEEIPELSSLFSVGDLVVAKLLECKTNEKGQKQIKASLNPHRVNELYLNTCLEAGLILPACVHSKEDHGYLLDIGVKNTRAFIKYSGVNRPLFPGQIVTCLIVSIQQSASMSILEVTLDEELIAASRLSPSQVSFLSLVPGMKVMANITQEHPAGWKAKLKHTQLKGFIPWDQMSDVPNAKVLTNKKVDLVCTVLYVLPRCLVFLSCSEPLLGRQSSRPQHRVGNFVQNGVITRVEPHGIYFQCEEDDIRGFISQYQGDCKPEFFHAKFRLGEVIKECRIIEFRRLENVYLASLSRKVLSSIASTEEVNLGDQVTCIVEGMSERGVIARVGYYKLRATCENEYVEGSKEMLREGQEVAARVIRIDTERNSLEVSFRALHLLASPLTSVKNTRPGKLVWGVLRDKLEDGVRVEFQSGICGLFPTKSMGDESKKLFYRRFVAGTVIVCQIFKYESGELLLAEADEKLHRGQESIVSTEVSNCTEVKNSVPHSQH